METLRDAPDAVVDAEEPEGPDHVAFVVPWLPHAGAPSLSLFARYAAGAVSRKGTQPQG
jgi:hypothetical protein